MQLAVPDEQRVPTEARPVREDHTLGFRGYLDVGEDLVGAPADVDRRRLGHRRGVRVVDVARPGRLALRPFVVDLLDGGPVIKGQNEIRLGLLEPGGDQFLQLLRMLVGEVAGLGAVLFDVVELPAVLVEVPLAADRRVQCGGFPAVLPDSAGAEHREVLPFLGGRGVGVIEAVAHRNPVEWVLLDPAVHRGHLQADGLQDRRHDVDGVVVLVAHLAAGLHPLGPVDDQRVTGAAGELRVALEHLERGGERHRPAGGVVVVGLRAAEFVEVGQVLLEAVREAVEELVLVHRSVRGALTGGTVVRAVEDDRVVELTGALQEVDDAAHLDVGVLGEPGEDLGHSAEQPLLVVVELGPRPHVVGLVGDVVGHRVQRGQLGALRHHAALDHPGQHPLAVGLVTIVEHALVLVDVLLRAVVRGVVGPGAEPHEPRLRRARGPQVLQHLDGLVGEVLGQVVALFGGVGRFDGVVVLDQVGIPLVGLAAQEAVEPVEALGQRPLRAAAGRGEVLDRDVVVLTQPHGRVAVVLQHLPDRRALGGQPAGGAGEAHRTLGDRRAPVHVVVAAGQERRAGGGAQRGGVPLGVGDAVVGEQVHGRHVDPAAVGRPRRQAGVVVQHDQDIGRVLRRLLQFERLPVRDRIANVELDDPVEFLGHVGPFRPFGY